tara:strand:- start:324 stop:899 length:576 start_codon:yes stop_codon:yes gene_type:complete
MTSTDTERETSRAKTEKWLNSSQASFDFLTSIIEFLEAYQGKKLDKRVMNKLNQSLNLQKEGQHTMYDGTIRKYTIDGLRISEAGYFQRKIESNEHNFDRLGEFPNIRLFVGGGETLPVIDMEYIKKENNLDHYLESIEDYKAVLATDYPERLDAQIKKVEDAKKELEELTRNAPTRLQVRYIASQLNRVS